MYNTKNYIFFTTLPYCLGLCFLLCKGQLLAQGCYGIPQYVRELQTDANAQLAISTEYKRGEMGLRVVAVDPQDTRYSRTLYQHDSWTTGGYLGPIARDPEGNVYVAPLPIVNMLKNPWEKLSTIYRVDQATAVMTPYIQLPFDAEGYRHNPFGILGSFYDCTSKRLIVSSVHGSSPTAETGKIFSVDVNTKVSTPIIEGIDAYGVAIMSHEGKRYLILGRTRSSKIQAIEIDTENQAVNDQLIDIIDLSGLGPRGDDRAKRIRMYNGQMVIEARPFYYNLMAPSERMQTRYYFSMEENDITNWKLDRQL